jgi:hypothetical protein
MSEYATNSSVVCTMLATGYPERITATHAACRRPILRTQFAVPMGNDLDLATEKWRTSGQLQPKKIWAVTRLPAWSGGMDKRQHAPQYGHIPGHKCGVDQDYAYGAGPSQ